MNYRKISSDVTRTLKLPEIYTFLCLAMKSDFYSMVSYINQDSLAEYVGVDVRTVQRHLSTIQKEGFIKTEKIKTRNSWGQPYTKNIYTLSTAHYVLIDEKLVSIPASREMKGFLILLKTLCVNNTNTCNFPVSEIVSRTAISSSTINRYLKQARDTGYIEWDSKNHHIRLINEDIFIVTQKSDIASAREQDRFMVKREQKKMEQKKQNKITDFTIWL